MTPFCSTVSHPKSRAYHLTMTVLAVSDISPEVRAAAEQFGLGAFEQAFKTDTIKRFTVVEVGRTYGFGHGLVQHDIRDGRAPLVFRYDQVMTTYQGRTAGFVNSKYDSTRFHYRFIRSDGVELEMKGMYNDRSEVITTLAGRLNTHQAEQYADLGFLAGQRIALIQLPAAITALEQGQALSFGKVSISRAGVHAKKGIVPWGELRELRISGGYAKIKKEGKFLALSNEPVARIPNFPLFRVLATFMSSGQR